MSVDFLTNIYGKSLFENEKNIKLLEESLQKLHDLDLEAYSEKLTMPVLVPIGSRIMFRGELKHTNEIMVSLGIDYFAKCSADQAEILKQQKIKDAKSKLESYKKERDYLQSQLSLTKQVMYDDAGYDIIEVVTDEEDKNWRELHRENVRKYKQGESNNDDVPNYEISNEDLWNRLEELELQEELQNEMKLNGDEKPADDKPHDDKPTTSKAEDDEDSDDDDDDDDDSDKNMPYVDEIDGPKVLNEIYLATQGNRRKIFQQPSKLDLFEQVVERHNYLKEMVSVIRERQFIGNNEEDLEYRLDDIERLEQLEDEMAILEDVLASDDDEIDEADEEVDVDQQVKKTVAFADQDDSETFELTFKHSEEEPSKTPYDPLNGITKPSDLYKAHPSYFNGETASILKKPKSNAAPEEPKTTTIEKEKQEEEHGDVNQDSNSNNTIILGDVVEKDECNEKTGEKDARPMSLFKKRRQQFKE